jgi:hypothetical protein
MRTGRDPSPAQASSEAVQRHPIAVDHQKSPRRVVVRATLKDPSIVDLRHHVGEGRVEAS